MRSLYLLFQHVLYCLFLLSCTQPSAHHKNDFIIEKGISTFNNDSFLQRPISLRGQWMFYWKQFYRLQDFSPQLEPHLIKVPSRWDHFLENKKPVGWNGYATYRLKITLPDARKTYRNLGLSFRHFSSAHRVYINDHLLASTGTVGKTKQSEKPYLRSYVVKLPPISREFELIVHVSNHHLAGGGIFNEVLFGSYTGLQTLRQKYIYFDLIQFGIILFVSFYHFILFLQRKRDRSLLYFSIGAFLISFLSIVMGDMRYQEFLILEDMTVIFKLAGSLIILEISCSTLFLAELYSTAFTRKFNQIILTISLFLLVITLPLPLENYPIINNIWVFIILVVIKFSLFIFIRMFQKGYPGGKAFLLGGLCFSCII
ncbi:MAG: 7TM diverse intracellular signaling domain-containing protein, partial [Spirochaetota bacterium]